MKETQGYSSCQKIASSSFVIQLVRTYGELRPGSFDRLHYWAAGGKESTVEVDLLIVRGKEIVAIEIKSGVRVQESWFKGLKAACEIQGVRKRILVYRGERSFRTQDKIEVFSLEKFLSELESGSPFPG